MLFAENITIVITNKIKSFTEYKNIKNCYYSKINGVIKAKGIKQVKCSG